MPDRFDESLLASPLDDERRSRRGVILGSLAVLLVVAVVAGVWLLPGDDAPGSGSVEATPGSVVVTGDGAVAADTTTTSATPLVVLWPYEPDPPILYHPTELPRGWEACRIIEDPSKGDRFCDPRDPDQWIQVRVRRARDARYDGLPPVGGDNNSGVWVERGATNEVAYRRKNVWVVVRNDDTLPPGTVLEIAASIPVVGAFDSLYGAYEVPLSFEEIADEEFSALLSEFGSEPSLTRHDLDIQVLSPTLSLFGSYADGYSVPDFAWPLPQPRLIDADRPIVIGYSAERNRAYAVWDQAGFGWRLEGRMTADEMAALALDLVEQISDLPTQ